MEDPFKIVWIGGLLVFFGVLLMVLRRTRRSFLYGEMLLRSSEECLALRTLSLENVHEKALYYTYGSWTCLASAVWFGLLALFQNTSLIVETNEWKS